MGVDAPAGPPDGRRPRCRGPHEQAHLHPGLQAGDRHDAGRLDEVRRLLESTVLPIDQIAAECGFSSPITMRQNFGAAFSTTPSEYRRRFTARPDPGDHE
ncbi:helix-turn-helix domain-containing protein [Micrococcus terreus]|uniref:helix-turn-helix domain-containing protein n=1 Tax=Micrococcus terreus TaxID=574650 RepID=UPI0035CCF707